MLVAVGTHKYSLTGITQEEPTELCKAFAFLYKNYKPDCYYWELFEMSRRLLLVGVAVVIAPGTILQLTMATGLCLIYVIIEQQQAPYLHMSDNVIALAASFSLTMFFFCCILLNLGLLLEQEDIRVRLSTRLR